MKSFVSVNSKYYKTSQVAALEAHNIRHINMTNKNVIDFETRKKHKKLFKNLNKKFNDFKGMLQKQKDIQNKNKSYHSSKSNTYYQQILVLSEEQFLEDLKSGNAKKIIKSIEDYMSLIEEKFGFKKLDYSLHMDEGYINEDGELKLNIHCHINYLNFDFEKERTVLRNLRRADFSLMQDLAEKAFQDNNLKYDRGVSKDKTLHEHKEKEEFVKEKLNKLVFDIKTIENMTENIEKYTLSNIDTFKENFKDNKKIKTILNAIYRARNNFEKQNDKYEQDLKRARNNLRKFNTAVIKSEINYHNFVSAKEVYEFKKNADKYVLKTDKDKKFGELKKQVLAAKFEYGSNLKAKDGEIRILKSKVKKLKIENEAIKVNANDLIDEVEEAEEYIDNNGLTAGYVEFKQSTVKTSELFNNDKKDNGNHSFKR